MSKATAKTKNLMVLQRLKKARQNAGLSQTQVAKMIDLSHATSFSDIERGENPLSVERLFLLCDIYGVDVSWVVTGLNPNFDRKKWLEIVDKSNVIQEEGQQIIELLETLRNDPSEDDEVQS